MNAPTVARTFVTLLCLAATLPALAETKNAELLWLGQAAFRLTTPTGKVIVIDPWIRANPLAPPDY